LVAPPEMRHGQTWRGAALIARPLELNGQTMTERNETDKCGDELMRSARLCFMLSFAQTVCSSAMVGDRALTVTISCAAVAAAVILRRAWTRPERKDHAADPTSPAEVLRRA
jgi:hypothetical protein